MLFAYRDVIAKIIYCLTHGTDCQRKELNTSEYMVKNCTTVLRYYTQCVDQLNTATSDPSSLHFPTV
jgi:hypothetical protein